jgi:TusA-related sulfurtransferase
MTAISDINKLDLRGVACPMNFVKAKLALDKLQEGSVLELILDAGEPISNVYESMVAEGHGVEQPKALPDGSFELQIKKTSAPCIDKKAKV